MVRSRARVTARLLAATAILSAGRIGAQTVSWANAVSGNWFDASKWAGGTAPNGLGFDAILGAWPSPFQVDLASNASVHSVQIASLNTLSISNNSLLTLANGGTLGNSGTLAIDSGSGLLCAAGAGYATIENAGTITLTLAQDSASWGNAQTVLNNTGVFVYSTTGLGRLSSFQGNFNNNGSVFVQGLQLELRSGGVGNGSYVVNPGSTLSLGSRQVDPGATFSGGGAVVFNDGVSQVNTPWNYTAGATTVRSSYGNTKCVFNQPVTSAVNLDGGVVQFNSSMTGTVLVSNQSGTVIPSGSQVQGTTLASGKWVIQSGGGLSLSTGSLTTNAADISMIGASASFPSLSGFSQNSGTLTLQSTNWPLGSAGVLTNSGYLNRSGTGMTFVPNTRTINNTGTISVSGGAMVIGATSNLTPAINPNTLTGGSWMVSNGGYLGFGGVIGGGTITTISPGTRIILDGAAAQMPALNYLTTNSGTLEVRGGGTLFYGNGLLNAGTVIVGANSAWMNFTSISLSGGTILLGADNSSPGVLRMLGSLTVPMVGIGGPFGAKILSSGTGALSGAIDLMNKTSVFSVANVPFVAVDLDVSANLFNGNINKTGSGVMRLSGSNSYQGTTFISDGTLIMGAAATLPSGTAVNFNSGASPARYLDLAGYAQTVSSIAGGGTILLGGATLTVNGTASTSFSGTVLGTGTFRKTGSGTLIVNGLLNQDGPLTVNDGFLQLTVAAEDNFTGPITVSGGVLSAGDDSYLGDPLYNSIALTGGTLAFGGASDRSIAVSGKSTIGVLATGTISGALSGNGTLTFSGSASSGTMTLNGTTTFGGLLSVNGAKISLAGGLARIPNVPSMTVSVGGILNLDRTLPGPGPVLSSGPAPAGGLQDIHLDGGTLAVSGPAATNTIESFGTLFLDGGASTIQTLPGSGGAVTLNFGSFGPRGTGATVNWLAGNPGVTDKIFFASGVSSGFIGSFFTVNGTDFAKYDATLGVLPFAGADYMTGFVRDSHVLLNAAASVPDTTVNPPDPFNIRTLNLASTGSLNVTIPASTTLQLTEGGLLKSGIGTSTISGGTLTWGGNELNISVSGGTLDISSTLSRTGGGTYTLTKRGDGTLTLSGSNASNYSGVTMISGAMQLNKPAGTNAIPGDLLIAGGLVTSLANEQILDSAKVTLNAGTLNLNGKTETISQLINNNGTVLFNGGTLTTANTTLSGGTTTVASTLNANTTLTITGGKNTVSATGVVNVGTLSLSGADSASIELASGAAGSGQLILSGNVNASPSTGTLKIISSGAGATPGKLDLGGAVRTFTVASGASREDLLVSAQVVSGGVIKTGPGMMQLSGSNVYAQGTTINSGTLEGISTTAFGSGSIQFGVGTSTVGTLGLRSDASVATFGNAIAAGSAARPIFVNIDRIISSSSNKFVLGTATLGSNLTVTGAGTLQVSSISLTATAVINPYGTTLSVNGGIHGAGLGVIYGGPAASPGEALPGSGSGNSGDSIGTIILNGSTTSTNTGLTTVAGGAFLGLNQTPGQYAIVGPVSLTDGTILCMQDDQFAHSVNVSMTTPGGIFNLNGTTQTIHDLTLQAGAVQTNGGTLNVTGTIATPPPAGGLPAGGGTTTAANASVQGNLSVNAGTVFNLTSATDQVTLNANLTAPAGFTLSGAGQLNLNGTNSITGTINLNGGTINASTPASLGSATIVLNGGILYATGSISNRIVLGASGGQIDVPVQQTLTMSQPLSGAGVTKTGAGTLILSGASSFIGNINLAAGTLQVANDGNLGSIANSVNLNGGNLAYSQSLSTTRTLNLNGGAIAVAAGQTVSLDGSGTLSGIGALVKTGPGTLNINRQRSYPGVTQVSGGTLNFTTQPTELLAGGTLSSGVWIVEANSTLNMTGPALTTNKASITLRGANSNFVNLSTFTRNEGSFTVEAGRSFTTSSAFSNAGTITIGSASGLKITDSIANTGTVDLSGATVVDYIGASPINSLRSQVISGYASGTWRGAGINSNSAAGDPRKAIAIAEASESGLAFSQISTDSTSVILLLTTRGDANLDSQVNSLDFNRFASNYGKNSNLWSDGDFNYDNKVNTIDFNYLAGNFGAVSGPLPAATVPSDTPDTGTGLGTIVPEPACLGCMASVSILAVRRREAKGKIKTVHKAGLAAI